MLGTQKGSATLAFLLLGIAVSGGIGYSTRQVIDEKHADAVHEEHVAELEAMLAEGQDKPVVVKKKIKRPAVKKSLAKKKMRKYKRNLASKKKKPNFYKRRSTKPNMAKR